MEKSTEENSFQLIDADTFAKLSEDACYKSNDLCVKAPLHNYCVDCPNTPMELASSEYQCPQCGQVRGDIESDQDHADTANPSIRRTTGASKGKYYTVNGDYTKTQRKFVHDQLLQNSMAWSGSAFPKDVLNAVADQYNMIQKVITEDTFDDDGKLNGQKKFVRRGNIKDEVLAGLIYFECIRKGLVRKKKDIAQFMNLHTQGFSRGEDILRCLHARGKIDIPIDEEPIDGFVDRYLEALNLENPAYSKFVIELVNKTEELKIGMNSQLSSKIVGSIWILIDKLKLQITAAQLERACDNTKKNTFMKFHRIVMDNMNTLAPIFTHNNVPFK